MKKRYFAAFSLTILLGAPAARADDFPVRKPGLWELRISPLGLPATKVKQCISDKTDSLLQTNGAEAVKRMGGKCTKNTMKKTDIGFEGEAVCEFNGSKVTAKTVLSGNFQDSYAGEVTTTFDPPLPNQPGTSMEMRGKYLGPCDGTLQPGEMLMENGKKLDVDAMATKESSAQSSTSTAPGEFNKKHHDILRQLDELKLKK